jgi:two-component system response regulator LytT
MINVLIIEDEAKAARELAAILKRIDDEINVLGILDSVEQSLQWFKTNKQPDLILTDIQLADGLCFDIYNQVNIQSPIIFCTAFDEYLMNAFDTNAVSYLLKPISREKVEKALEKFHAMRSAFEKKETNNITGLLQQLKYQYKTALLVHHKEKIIPVPVKDIACFYLDKNLLSIVTVTNQKYHLSSTLDEIEKLLDPAVFYRANRQFLINKAAIANAERFFARKLVVKLIVDTPETIIVSKAKASEFLEWMEA